MVRRVAGRPAWPGTDLAAQRRRTMSRCQRRIVSGVTSSRSPWRRALGSTPSRVVSRARSAQFSFGRRGCRRCRTASWWRKIKISAVFHASSRRDSRSHETARLIRRKTNRRHMIGDHHGRTAGGATLLVRAVDGILGTHKRRAAPRRAGGQAARGRLRQPSTQHNCGCSTRTRPGPRCGRWTRSATGSRRRPARRPTHADGLDATRWLP